jgi:opacity protein-like surface antigen
VAVDARVPHPFFFNQARTVTGTADNLSRREIGLHGRVSWMAAMGGGWELTISGGPSFFGVEQDLVEDITINESYPFDTATFASAVATRHSSSGLGFNVGADVTKLFTAHMGVGAAFTIARAKLKFDTFSDPARSFDVGGARVGGGLRFRF